MKNKGKIIAVVGGPRSGKSFLVRLLAEYYRGTAFLEGEEHEFPNQIKEDISKNIRPLERICWFRNKQVRDFIKALNLKESGEIAIIDNFWISYQLYIDALAHDFEGEIIREMAMLDQKTMVWPDVTILLTLSEEGVRNFIKIGGREFDQSEDFIKNQALPIHKLHLDFFKDISNTRKVIILDRDALDFNNKEHFNNLVTEINKLL